MQIWDWMIDMTKKSTEKVRLWSEKNRERRRKMTNEAVARYRERHKDDPEYWEKKRESGRKSSITYRKKMKETMTPEQREEERRKNRERQARFRERQKLKKLQEATNEETKKGSPEA